MTKVFLDTNILVYALDDSDIAKRDISQNILLSKKEFVISTQVLLELFSVMTRKLSKKISAAEAAEHLLDFNALPVVSADAYLVLRAARTVVECQVSIWDAMIIEAAVQAGCDELWSEDLQAGASVRGVKVVNPFA